MYQYSSTTSSCCCFIAPRTGGNVFLLFRAWHQDHLEPNRIVYYLSLDSEREWTVEEQSNLVSHLTSDFLQYSPWCHELLKRIRDRQRPKGIFLWHMYNKWHANTICKFTFECSEFPLEQTFHIKLSSAITGIQSEPSLTL